MKEMIGQKKNSD